MGREISGTITALLIAIVGYGIAAWIGFPAAMLSGPAILVTLAALAGVRVSIPRPLRDLSFVALGLSLSVVVTPEALAVAWHWPLSFLLLALCIIVSMILCMTVLRYLFGYDHNTALLASCPGYLSYVISVATEAGHKVALISTIHSTRLLSLVVLVPLFARAFGVDRSIDMLLIGDGSSTIPIQIFVSAIAVIVGYLFTRIRLPAGFLQGGLITGIVAQLSGSGPIIPSVGVAATFVVIGALIGSRFSGINTRSIIQWILVGLLITAIMMLVAIASALLGVWLLDLGFIELTTSYAPGGLESMGALALSFDVDVTTVIAHHVARLMILAVLMPIFLTSLQRRLRRRDPSA